jgi:hypothetical protein
MRRVFRRFCFLFLIVVTMLSAQVTTSSSTTLTADDIDPACVSYCTSLLYECLLEGGKNGQDNSCISVYRHCTAQCKH